MQRRRSRPRHGPKGRGVGWVSVRVGTSSPLSAWSLRRRRPRAADAEPVGPRTKGARASQAVRGAGVDQCTANGFTASLTRAASRPAGGHGPRESRQLSCPQPLPASTTSWCAAADTIPPTLRP